MREVINHLTYIYLLNTIKSILIQTLEKFCKKRVYGKQTLTTYISEIFRRKLIKASQCETEIIDCIQYIKNMCIKREKKQHMQRQVKKTYIIKDKDNVCKHGHKTGVQEQGSKHSPEQDETHLPLTKECISPPNMQNLKKKKTTKSPQFSPLFVMIDKEYKKLESFTRET